MMLNRTSTSAEMEAVLPGSTAHVLHRDFESRSQISLKTAGLYKYAAHPTTEVLACAFAVDNDSIQLWLPGDPIPSEFVVAANSSNWLVAAHGAHFETAIEKQILAPRYGWPLVPVERHRCTQALCLA